MMSMPRDLASVLFNVLLARTTTNSICLVKPTTAIAIRCMHLFPFLLVAYYFDVLEIDAVVSVWVDSKAGIESLFSSTGHLSA